MLDLRPRQEMALDGPEAPTQHRPRPVSTPELKGRSNVQLADSSHIQVLLSPTPPSLGGDPRQSVKVRQRLKKTNIWVTMALCWSGNTQYHGKSKFPYREALPLSTQLWRNLTTARVVVQIVYNETSISEALRAYRTQLEGYGALVKLIPTEGMDCVLKAQLIRILVFDLPEVSPEDVVVLADVDGFIMTPTILLPIKVLPKKQFWIYRYELTFTMGYTFMLAFIGARAKTWKQILPHYHGDIPQMIQTYSQLMNFSQGYTWDIDQHIVSYGILQSQLCSLPEENKLWQKLNLKPNAFNDNQTCWHGNGVYEDCNNKLWSRNMLIRYHGHACKWWHFYPDETTDQLQAKFQEIMSGTSESGILTTLIGKSKSIADFIFERNPKP
eukprot:maker-scaffold125_size330479-snap-gene-0.11 protein:Tk06885 transcript:maker-scaffold125_size330479-snap-gene-0.11-mRNA-1 annotation:"hypothetical protein"